MYRSEPVVTPEDVRLDFIIESPRLIRINYPAINIGFKLFEHVRLEFEKVDQPWKYDCMFNMLPFQGHILFDELDAFRESWYRMVGDRDIGRKVASVSLDPLTAERFETYKVLFPTRVFRLFHTVTDAYAWLNGDI